MNPLDELDVEERAIVVAMAMTRAEGALARLAPAPRMRCKAALEWLRGVPRKERAHVLARTAGRLLRSGRELAPSRAAASLGGERPQISAALLLGAPAELREAALGALPPPVREALSGARPASIPEPLLSWLRRRLLGTEW
jgi:hypothetical protein